MFTAVILLVVGLVIVMIARSVQTPYPVGTILIIVGAIMAVVGAILLIFAVIDTRSIHEAPAAESQMI